MKFKKLFAPPLCKAIGLIFTISLLAPWPSSGLAQPISQEVMAQRLQVGVNWLNAAMLSSSLGTRTLQAQLLPMDIGNYKDFVQLAYPERGSGLDIGTPGLSAFFQAGAQVDQKLRDVCYLLYNPKAGKDLLDQFIEPHTKFAPQDPPSVVPYAFLVAHEMGHCLDFQAAPSASRSHPLASLRMEVAADAFALLVLRAANVPPDELSALVSSRRRTVGSHATWRWIQPALSTALPPTSPRLIKELWEMADAMSEKVN